MPFMCYGMWFDGNYPSGVGARFAMKNQMVRKKETGSFIAISAIIGAIGLVCLISAAQIAASTGENVQTIRLVAGMIMLIGIAVLFSEKTDLSIDEKGGKLLLRKSGVFKNSLQKIPLTSISGVRVRKRHNKDGIDYGYSLQIRCRDGKSIYHTGGLDKENEFYSIAERIAEVPGVEKEMPYMMAPLPIGTAGVAIISLLTGQAVYAIIYGCQTGWHFCPAMWAGTAPPFVIGTVGMIVWRSLRSIKVRV